MEGFMDPREGTDWSRFAKIRVRKCVDGLPNDAQLRYGASFQPGWYAITPNHATRGGLGPQARGGVAHPATSHVAALRMALRWVRNFGHDELFWLVGE